MLPANMFGEMTSSCGPLLMRSPCSRSSGSAGLPLRCRLLAIGDRDRRVPVVIAVDEPFEPEIDQRRRIDDELAGRVVFAAIAVPAAA